MQPALKSGFLQEAFLAAGTGDGDLAFAPGNADGLMALGAVKIAMLPVLQTVIDLQEAAVFLITLVGVPGQAAENGPDHQTIAQRPENQVKGLHRNHHRQQTGHQAGAEDRHIQTVGAIATGHKAAKGGCQFEGDLAKPATESIHKKITFCVLLFSLIILQKIDFSTTLAEC